MSITLHKTRGVNPKMTFCPRCGGEANELMLIGNREAKMTCQHCGTVNFGARGADRCGGCGKHGGLRKTGEIGEHERLPASQMCDACQKDVDMQKAEVEKGGVYWKCDKCKHSGVIKAHHQLAKDVRASAKIEPPNPVGIDFTSEADSSCPVCTGSVKPETT